jgi:hypothetical protein
VSAISFFSQDFVSVSTLLALQLYILCELITQIVSVYYHSLSYTVINLKMLFPTLLMASILVSSPTGKLMMLKIADDSNSSSFITLYNSRNYVFYFSYPCLSPLLTKKHQWKCKIRKLEFNLYALFWFPPNHYLYKPHLVMGVTWKTVEYDCWMLSGRYLYLLSLPCGRSITD